MKKLLSLVFITVSSIIFAAVKMDPVFGSHMVLQQEKPISFFGTAAPNSKVTVELTVKLYLSGLTLKANGPLFFLQ